MASKKSYLVSSASGVLFHSINCAAPHMEGLGSCRIKEEAYWLGSCHIKEEAYCSYNCCQR
jgi:hypothetical protein